jgi:aminoglycoside 3-N-acetyltransferase I
MTYACRKLEPGDVATLKALLAVFGDAFGEVQTYGGAIPGDDYLRKLLGKPHFIALVASAEGAVVGGLAAYELEKFEQARSEIYIYDLAVQQAHRRAGVATALIRELQRIAKARGAYVIFVQADLQDTPAIRLYESLGTREDVHHFDIPVEQVPTA